MAKPKRVSLKTLGRWAGSIGWNPPAKLVYVGKDGRRRWQVTRLAAVVYNARRVAALGLKPELSIIVKGKEYEITNWSNDNAN